MNTRAIKGKLKQRHAALESAGEIEKFSQEDSSRTFPPSASKQNESGDDRPVLYDDEPVRRNEALHPG
jgi:hypothetical protein